MHTLVCGTCGKEYSTETLEWRCGCGGIFELRGGTDFSIEEIDTAVQTLWRYRSALPLSGAQSGSGAGRAMSLGEGWTPLVAYSGAASDISHRDPSLPSDAAPESSPQVLLKLDHLFPSGSYKDRGAAVLMSKVAELGIERVVEDSSGNAGAAIAAYAAAAGISAEIYVPAANSPEKLAQIRSYGARLVPVEGSRSDTAAAAMEAAADTYYASHVYNPFFIEGTKTFAYELWEQLGYRAPETVVLPAGNGTLLLGSYKGFSELKSTGLIERIPVHVAVQTAACAPLASAAAEAQRSAGAAGADGADDTVAAVSPEPTAAEGIAIVSPPLLERMAEVVRNTGGKVITVDEDEIVAALSEAVGRGIYIEPTAAASLAGLRLYLEGEMREDTRRPGHTGTTESAETIVGVTTGHGLKAPGKIAKLLEKSGPSQRGHS